MSLNEQAGCRWVLSFFVHFFCWGVPVVDVPATFSPGVKLLDVEGVPVTLGNVPGVEPSSAAWDRDPPRVFDPGSAMRNGAPVSVEEFRALVEAGHAKKRPKASA